MAGNYVGDATLTGITGPAEQRYFYALRTDDEGNIYFTKADIWAGDDVIEVNVPGDVGDDWQFFEVGVDYYDGKNPETHVKDTPNLKFDQYRFDSRSLYYYINDNGELVVRYNKKYDYPTDV